MTYLKTPSTNPVAVPFTCESCAGEGGSEYVDCRYGCEQKHQGCTHATWTFEECGACGGTGLEPCGFCGSEAATDIAEDGTKACRFCVEASS